MFKDEWLVIFCLQVARSLCHQKLVRLSVARTDFDHVVKATCFLSDINDFAAFNAVYQTAFSSAYPARSAVEVARLPRDVKIEIEVIAELD